MLDISTPKIIYDGSTLPVPDEATHSAVELNDRIVEMQGVVTDSGQALDAADAGQLSKSVFTNAVSAQSMLAGGTVNDIQLTPVTGANGFRLATPVVKDYSLLDGAIFSFRAGGNNTGNMTVNVGQTGATLIGAKDLFLEDGITEVPVGAVVSGSYYSVRFTSAGGGAFEIISGVARNYGEFTALDDDGNAILAGHAYLANQDGTITVDGQNTDSGVHSVSGFIGDTDDPVGAGTDIQSSTSNFTNAVNSITFPVARGKYFEIVSSGNMTLTIIWHPVGTLIPPTDQD